MAPIPGTAGPASGGHLQLPAAGTYTVSVREFPDRYSNSPGSEPEWADLPQGYVDTYGFVNNNGKSTTGHLTEGDVADTFDIYLVVGTTYRIDMKGTESSQYGGTLINPQIILNEVGDFATPHIRQIP